MSEALPVVGAMLDALVLVFLLILHRRKDERTWNQRMGATLMAWYLVCHLGYQWASGAFGYNFSEAGTFVTDVMDVLVWNLWRIGMLAFFVAMFTVPMPWFRKTSTYLGLFGGLLVLNLVEAWFVHGTPAYSGYGWNLWFAMSPEAIVMMAVFAYLAWSFLTSDTEGEDGLEKTTDKAGLFAILALTLWLGKNWFDWLGMFTGGAMFYGYWPAWSHPMPLLTAFTWNYELVHVVLSLVVLFAGAVLHLNKNGSKPLSIFLILVLVLGVINHLLFQGEEVDYNRVAAILNEASVAESFAMLTHGTMQSIARPLIILFIIVRFGFVDTSHLPRLSRAMIIMAIAGSVSTVTEILQPILGISQLVSGFLLGAVLAFELEKRVLKAIQPPEGDFNPEWVMDGDVTKMERWTNIGFAVFLLVSTLMVVLFTDTGVSA